MVAFKLLVIDRIVPRLDLRTGRILNPVSNDSGQFGIVANAEGQVSQWWDAIVGKNGDRAYRTDGSGYVEAHQIEYDYSVPDQWRSDSAATLATEGRCIQLGSHYPVGCAILIDLKNIGLKQLGHVSRQPNIYGPSMPTVKLAFTRVGLAVDFGDAPPTLHPVAPLCINSNCSRVKVWVEHKFLEDGHYDLTLWAFLHERERSVRPIPDIGRQRFALKKLGSVNLRKRILISVTPTPFSHLTMFDLNHPPGQ